MGRIKRAVAAALVCGTVLGVSVPALEAHAAASAPHFVIQADFVLGAEGQPQGAPVCVPNAVFHPGDQIVWRARIADAATGKQLTAAQVKQLGVTATVVLKSGAKLPMQLGQHPPAEAKPPKQSTYWTAAWKVGKTVPMGPLSWTIQVKDKMGDTTSFAPIGQDVGIPSILVAPKK
jgi:hypothetical protein